MRRPVRKQAMVALQEGLKDKKEKRNDHESSRGTNACPSLERRDCYCDIASIACVLLNFL